MLPRFTLEYWPDDGWYVGRLKELPEVFSQGASLAELGVSIQDTFDVMLADRALSPDS